MKASLKRMDVSSPYLRRREIQSAHGLLEQIEYIDLLQCHRFDPETPIEETMDALHDVSR